MQTIEMEGQPVPAACQRAYCESGLWVNPWVVVPLKDPFEFKASQSTVLSYIYSLDSDQMGSSGVDEKEQNTACENTQEDESLFEFHASYTFSITKDLCVYSIVFFFFLTRYTELLGWYRKHQVTEYPAEYC